MGWIFDRDMSNQQRFAPDLLADKDIVRVNKYFWVWTMVSRARCRRWSAG